METEYEKREIEILETRLRNEEYRYQLALKDGALNSIVIEIIERINSLERELRLKKEASDGLNGDV